MDARLQAAFKGLPAEAQAREDKLLDNIIERMRAEALTVDVVVEMAVESAGSMLQLKELAQMLGGPVGFFRLLAAEGTLGNLRVRAVESCNAHQGTDGATDTLYRSERGLSAKIRLRRYPARATVVSQLGRTLHMR